jgi:hypothetical protein
VVRERSRRWLPHLVFPLLGLLVIGYVLQQMDDTAKQLGLGWIGLGALYFAALRLGLHRSANLPPLQ